MVKKKPSLISGLGRRERQIMDAVFELGHATVTDVLQAIPEPPSYSSVRTMLCHLEKKGLLQHSQEGLRYVYSPTDSTRSARQSAIAHLIKTYFQGSVGQAAASILDSKSSSLTDEELNRIEKIIEQVRKAKS